MNCRDWCRLVFTETLFMAHQHSFFNVSWRHASLLWRWHVVSSLLLMDFGVTDLRGRLTGCEGMTVVMGFFRQLQRTAGFSTVWPFVRRLSTLPISSKQTLRSIHRNRRDWRRVEPDSSSCWACNTHITLVIRKGNRSDGKECQFHSCGREVCVQTIVEEFPNIRESFPANRAFLAAVDIRDKLSIQTHSSRDVRKSSTSEHTRLRPQTVDTLFIRIQSNVHRPGGVLQSDPGFFWCTEPTHYVNIY